MPLTDKLHRPYPDSSEVVELRKRVKELDQLNKMLSSGYQIIKAKREERIEKMSLLERLRWALKGGSL